MDVEAALQHAYRLIELLNNRRPGDQTWQDPFDSAFLQAAFNHNHEQPFFIGPDGNTYFGFIEPEGKIAVANPAKHLDDMVHWVAGAAILAADRRPAYVYSAGDIVALKLHGRTAFGWGGNWNRPPDSDYYSKAARIMVAQPNEHMLPPLAARSLEFNLRLSPPLREALGGRLPGVLLLRLDSNNRPEDPSELTLNITKQELGKSDHAIDALLELIGAALPRYIARRFILLERPQFDAANFTPLQTIIEQGGLQLAPHR